MTFHRAAFGQAAVPLLLCLLLPETPARPAAAQDASVLEALPHEILWERREGRTTLVLRWLSPRLDATPPVPFETVEATADRLCRTVALPLARMTGGGEEAIVTLLARPLARGRRDPSVRRHIFAYDISEGRCTWLP